jgi:hypothetical protein
MRPSLSTALHLGAGSTRLYRVKASGFSGKFAGNVAAVKYRVKPRMA